MHWLSKNTNNSIPDLLLPTLVMFTVFDNLGQIVNLIYNPTSCIHSVVDSTE